MHETILHCNINSLTNHSIILDVDETLVHTFEDIPDEDVLRNLNKNCLGRLYMYTEYDFDGKGSKDEYICAGVLRPGVESFMDFCFGYFRNVIFWSAGEDKYVRKIVERLTKTKSKPNMIYTRDNCKEEHNKLLTKPLDKILETYKNNHSLKIEHLFALDDRDATFTHNIKNGIMIPPYEPLPNEMCDYDNALEKLTNWFLREDVISSTDVRNLDKTKIFK